MNFKVPSQGIRFTPEVAALDTVFPLRPLGEATDAFRTLLQGQSNLPNDTYAYWFVLPWDAEHELGEEEYVTEEQWNLMYECAKSVGLDDDVPVLVDVTW